MLTEVTANELLLPGFLHQPGVRQLFVHDTATMDDPAYSRAYEAVQHFFAERALWLATPDDLVLLAEPIEPAYLEYLAAQQLGPCNPPLVVPAAKPGAAGKSPGMIQRLLQNPGWWPQLAPWMESSSAPVNLSVFCATRLTTRLSEELSRYFQRPLLHPGDARATERANHKCYTRAQLPQLGIKPIPGRVITVDHQQPEAALQKLWQGVQILLEVTQRVIIRADYASGGVGNLLLDGGDAELLARWLPTQAPTCRFLVEAYLPSNTSPNVQFWIDPDGIPHHFQTTDQRMCGEVAYNGNRYPAAADANPALLESAQKVAGWLARTGVRGMIGMDYLVTRNRRGRTQIQFVEVNARQNGSTYASSIWFRINQIRARNGAAFLPCWQLFRSATTELQDFAALQARTADLLYLPERAAGVIPYWTGAMAHGLCSCLTVAESPSQAQALEEEFLHRIGHADP